MKEIKATKARKEQQDVIYKGGNFSYSFDENWGSLPQGLDNLPFVTGCCDENEIYLITRDSHNPIIVLDSDGKYLRSMGAGLCEWLHCIRVTPNNTLMCVDSNSHILREFSKEGGLLRNIGSGQPSASGHDPNVWFNRMKRGDVVPMNIAYDPYWAFAESISTIQCAAPPFNRPTAVDFNSKGEMFCSDGYGNAAVHKFSPEYELVKTWGGPGKEPGKFLVPHGIRVDKRDRVWVADREGSSVHVFDEEGDLIYYFSPEKVMQPSEIWSDDDYIYIGERGGITIVNMDMEIEAQLGYFYSPLMVHGLFGDNRNNLYITNLGLPVSYNHLRRLKRIK